MYGSASYAATMTISGPASNAGTLTIDAYSAFDVTGSNAFSQTGGTTTISADGAFSAATIDIDGGAFVVDATNFTNSGKLAAADGGDINLGAGGLTNLSGGTLTGGTYEVDAGSTLQLPNDTPIVTDDADIILSGAGSTIEDYNTTTGAYDTVDATLLTIGASGQLHLLASRGWTTAGAAITNDGQIQLSGGKLSARASGASLTNAAGARIYGKGTLAANAFTNSGTIEASGGTLTLSNAVGGTGDLRIDASATLVLAGTAATTDAATFNGAGATLTLNHLGNLIGAIGGVGLDDTFHLVGVTANGASVNGSDQLVVTDNGTTVDTLQLIGTYSRFTFLTQAVSGGTDVISLPIPATVADYLDVPTLYDQIPRGFAISDAAAKVVAGLSTLNADSHVASITVTSGSATLSGGVGVNAPSFSETGSGTSLTIGEALAYAGNFSQGAGSTTAITTGDSLSLTGTASLSGTTSGAGTLALAGGTATIDSGATVTASIWSISGAGTDVEALTYSGSFSEGAGDTFVLSGGNLLLNGADTFSGGTVDGSKLLETEGTTTVSGLTIGGTVEWENTNSVTQSGTVTIGDGSGDVAFLDNTSTGTYDITANSGINQGSSTASNIVNAGLFEEQAGRARARSRPP